MPQLPAPAPPPPPPPPLIGGDPFIVDAPTRPLTGAEIQRIREQRSELSKQLNSAADRRQELAQELRLAEGEVDRTGIEDRIRVLDERIVQLETDMATTGRLLTGGQTIGISSTGAADMPFYLSPDQVTGISIVFILAVMFPMSIAMARRIWRKAPIGVSPSDVRDISTKLEGLQQAMDTVAIEVERVSEGQRFVTRLMTEGPAAEQAKALGMGTRAAEHARIPGRDR